MAAEWLKIGEERPEEIIDKASTLLRRGKIVVLPTETVYGLGADRDNPQTIRRLYEIKERPLNKPFTLHIADAKSFYYLASPQKPYVYRLIEKFWPGPLTLIVEGKEGKKIGMRNPNFPLTRQIIRRSGVWVVMPSANLSGEAPAKEAEEVFSVFGNKVDLVVTASQPLKGISSTIVDISAGNKIIRRGIIAAAVEKEVKKRRVLFVCSGNTCRSVIAEYLLRDYLNKRRPQLKDKVEVVSAGVFAIDNMPASSLAIEVLKREGIDAALHRSRRLSPLLIKGSDLIIVMEEKHKDIVASLDKDIHLRLFHINYFLKEKIDIYDPLGGGLEAYEEVYSLIKKAVENIGKKL